MKNRCFNVNNHTYHLYGGRGITVCQRWADSFPAFLADMGPRPTKDHSIDRINNDGNYEPSNCRWATHSEQMKNRHWTPPTQGRRSGMDKACAVCGATFYVTAYNAGKTYCSRKCQYAAHRGQARAR
jgi:hypothetical protein